MAWIAGALWTLLLIVGILVAAPSILSGSQEGLILSGGLFIGALLFKVLEGIARKLNRIETMLSQQSESDTGTEGSDRRAEWE